MTDTPATTTASAPPSLIALYGLDQAGKSHASTFKGAETELAQKAAALMGMQVLPLAGEDHVGLAERLPVGRVFASGKAFVPFVKKALYDRLCALGGVPAALPPAARPTRTGKQASADNEPSGDAGDAEPTLPTDWDAIGLNSLVLATTGPQEGWFEAVVTRAKSDSQVLVLRWLDWPDEPQFSRRRSQLALLPGAAAPQADAASSA